MKKKLLAAAALAAATAVAVAAGNRWLATPQGASWAIARECARECLSDDNIERVLYFWSGDEDDPRHLATYQAFNLFDWCGCFGTCDCE